MTFDEVLDCAIHTASCKKYINLICEYTDNIILYIKNNDRDSTADEISHLYYALNNLYNRKYINQRFLDAISALINRVYLFYAGKKEYDIDYFYKLQIVFDSLRDDMDIYQNERPHNLLSIIVEYEL